MSFLTGLWPIIAHFSWFTLAIVACIVLATFIDALAAWPPLKWLGLDKVSHHIRDIALATAAAIALSLFWYAKGVSDEGARCKLQFKAAKVAGVKHATAARIRAAVDDDRGVRDSRDTDSHK